MSAIVDFNGRIRQLDRGAEPEEQVQAEDVTDPPRLARLLMRILSDVAALKRRFWPRHLDFEGCAMTDDGVTKYRFEHRFGGKARWWAVDWTSEDGGVDIVRDADSNDRTLVLRSYCTGTITLRIAEAG